MSKIVKKKELDTLIESTLKKAGIEIPKKETPIVESKEEKKVVTEEKKVVTESSEKKSLLNEDFKKELAQFNKLTNYKY